MNYFLLLYGLLFFSVLTAAQHRHPPVPLSIAHRHDSVAPGGSPARAQEVGSSSYCLWKTSSKIDTCDLVGSEQTYSLEGLSRDDLEILLDDLLQIVYPVVERAYRTKRIEVFGVIDVEISDINPKAQIIAYRGLLTTLCLKEVMDALDQFRDRPCLASVFCDQVVFVVATEFPDGWADL